MGLTNVMRWKKGSAESVFKLELFQLWREEFMQHGVADEVSRKRHCEPLEGRPVGEGTGELHKFEGVVACGECEVFDRCTVGM